MAYHENDNRIFSVRFKDYVEEKAFSILLIGMLVVFFCLLFRNFGSLYVVTDESSFVGLLRKPIADNSLSAYLFQITYQISLSCGDRFYECGKTINALFFVGSAFFIYHIAARITKRSVAVAIALTALFLPTNVYTGAFMPESMFLFFVWGGLWQVLRAESTGSSLQWILAGVWLGCLCLIKPHGLFLIPAFLAYAVLLAWHENDRWHTLAFRNTLLIALTAFAVRSGIAFLCAGKAGLSLLGLYANHVGAQVSFSTERIMTILGSVSINAWGNAMMLAAIFGLPLAIIIDKTLTFIRHKRENCAQSRIAILFVCSCFSLVAMSVMFVAQIADVEQGVSRYQIMSRYYTYFYPIFIIALCFFYVKNQSLSQSWLSRGLIFLPLAVASAAAIFTRMKPYSEFETIPLFAKILWYQSTLSLLALLFGFIALLVWVKWPTIGKTLYIVLSLPIILGLVNSFIWEDYSVRVKLEEHDTTIRGINAAKALLLPDDIKKTMVVMGGSHGLFFHYIGYYNLIIHFSVMHKFIGSSDYDWRESKEQPEWLVLVRPARVNPELEIPYSLELSPTVSLIRTPYNLPSSQKFIFTNNASFTYSLQPNKIKTSGLSMPAWHGSWSDGKTVHLEFPESLPTSFTLSLVANSFGPNEQFPFIFKIGSISKEVMIPQVRTQIDISLTNEEESSLIEIIVPKPTSPISLGLSGEERNLGINLYSLEIISDALSEDTIRVRR